MYRHYVYIYTIYTLYIVNEYTHDLLHMYNCGYVIHHPTVVEGGQHEPPQRVRIRGAVNFSTQRGTNGKKKEIYGTSMGNLWKSWGKLWGNDGNSSNSMDICREKEDLSRFDS